MDKSEARSPGRSRRLLAPGYTETHYNPDGQPVVLVPNHTDHCHYHGHVRGFPDSWVVFSTCSGMRGLITLGCNASYYVHPWSAGDSEDFITHKMFQTQQLLSWKRACGHRDARNKGDMASLSRATQIKERREVRKSPKFLELYIVADHTLFLTQHRNLNHTKQRLLEVANYVDQILRTLDIQVALTGLEVWTEQDQSRVSPDANATLWAFLQWRRGLWARRPHDSAQLLTGRAFRGATVGLAPIEGMCRAESSGGVSTDHSELPIGAAATMAHEIGHSLGLSHDPEGCCVEAAAEQGGCVMAAATGYQGRRGGRVGGGGGSLAPGPSSGAFLWEKRSSLHFVFPKTRIGSYPPRECFIMLRRRKLGKSGFPKVYGLLPEHSSEDSPPPGVTAPRSRFALLGSLVLASHPPTAGSPRDFAQVTCPLWALPRGDPGRLSLRRCPRIQGLGGRAQRVVVGGGRGEVAVPARPTPLPPRRHPFPRVFSACSRRQLRAFFRKGGGACLSNAPDSRLLVPRARCGNGLVEEGEECDCGASQECQDACCLAHNCSLRAGAQCSHGDCCARCLLKPAGVPCRRAVGDCDLPEFCTGASPYCPPDIYLLDGSPCASGRGYCWDGACPTLEEQCQQLWGPGSSPAPELCFQIVNSAGDAHGNCGQDGKGGFVPCAQRDAQCGKLQCLGGEQHPLPPHTVPVDSSVGLGREEVTCRGVFLLPGVQLDLLDLGLVEPGTPCGPRMVCQNRRCQNTTFLELEQCLTTCHGHGVCNSNKNCHCAPGWAPPSCDKPGFGGSVDSGPMQPENHKTFLLGVILSFLLPLLPGAGLAWCCCRQPRSGLQQCLWGLRRDPSCSRPKDGPNRDRSSSSIHPMELGPAATGEPQPLDLENSARAQEPP